MIPINDVSAQNDRMHNGENIPKDIQCHVREWIVQNKVEFDSWIEEALKEAQS